jgi:hypothetical protein
MNDEPVISSARAIARAITVLARETYGDDRDTRMRAAEKLAAIVMELDEHPILREDYQALE